MASKRSLTEIKAELKKLGLPVSGLKDDLVARLEEAQKAEASGESPAKKQKTSEEPASEASPTAPIKIAEIFAKPSPSASKAAAGATAASIPTGTILDGLTEPGWRAVLASEFNQPYFKEILKFLDAEQKRGAQIFPPREEIFAAFNYTPWDQLKVVLIGQDPYHDDNQAHGLCFSVKKGIKPPPSLKNIYMELTTDIPGFTAPSHGNLEKWARGGVLLLNATLTVEAHKANSHSKVGWLRFTEAVIRIINEKHSGVVFILWGGFAQKLGKGLDRKKHVVIEAAHPSPLSVTKFKGSKSFSKANEALKKLGKEPVDWTLPASI